MPENEISPVLRGDIYYIQLSRNVHIVAHLIDGVSVKKGYELTVNFKISLEQFENGLEFQALSS